MWYNQDLEKENGIMMDKFSLWATEDSPSTSSTPPSSESSIATSEQHHISGRNPKNNTPPPTSMLHGWDPVSKNTGSTSVEPSIYAVAPNIFSTEFIENVAKTLDSEFNPGKHEHDGEINFERDFGQWFNRDVTPL